MCSESISLRDPRILNLIMMIIGIVVIIFFSGYLIYMGCTTEYIHLYPLDKSQTIVLPFKLENIVAIYDLKSNQYEASSIIVLNGITTSISLARSYTSYAMIYSRGVDIYLIIISILSIITYITGYIKFSKLRLGMMRIVYNILFLVIILIVLGSSLLYINFNETPSTLVTQDTIEEPIRFKLSKPIKLNVTLNLGGRQYNGTVLVYNIDRVKDRTLIHIESDKIVLVVAVSYIVSGDLKLRSLANITREYTGYVHLPNNVEEGNLLLIYDPTGYDATVTYMKLGFIELQRPDPYLLLTPALGLLAIIIIISVFPRMYTRKIKSRSSLRESSQDKHSSEEARDQSSEEVLQHADKESRTPNQPPSRQDE